MRTALMALVLLASEFALSQTCSLPPDLYRERVRLVERYAEEVGNNYLQNKAAYDDILQKKRAVDQKYFEYMGRVANGTSETIRECCPSSQEDLIALRICALSSYLQSGRKNVESFLASVPGDQKSAQSLWLLDEIVYSHEREAANQIPFRPLGPVTSYLSELYKLVLKGEQEAIRKYLSLVPLAEGDAGEQMAAQGQKLFLDHPRLMIENWDIFGKYPETLETIREMMSTQEKHQALSAVQKECSTKRRNCREISSFLEQAD